MAAGVVALLAFLGVAELVAAAVGPGSAPAIAIGENAIAHTPQDLKEFAISHFGENDKNVLLAGIYATLALMAAVVGLLASLTRRAVAVVSICALGAVAAISAVTQATASLADGLPSLAGALAAVCAVALLLKARPDAPARADVGSKVLEANTLTRRRFIVAGASVAGAGAALYAVGSKALNNIYNATRSRAAVRLPKASNSTPVVGGTGLDVAGLSPYITPNEDFYRVDTALVVPQLSTQSYGLNVHGMVDEAAIYSFDDLVGMELVERTITMVCVSNPVGGPYLGNARWTGVLLADLLRKARPHPGANQLLMTSSDGMTIGADLATVLDGRPALLALGMNGEPLPFEHGFPVRAVIPGVYGYASACKWLVDLEVTTFAAKKAYWVQRGYAERAPVKLESKIDTPASFAQLKAGPVVVAGAAWNPTVGVKAVQVQVDEGPWHEAALAAVESVDTWRLWRWDWDATPGSHSLTVRAVGANGETQTASQAPVVPNGTSGHESVVVTVS
ncbi:MAG TPA: molybdopterin-dependent oxidoreductase [Acidimicrobiales bacterium]|nr:molybdopterin-dependent oxidoreductase [Acidimicrobiales bacterium]